MAMRWLYEKTAHLDKRSVILRGLLWMISTPYRIPAAQQKRISTSPYFFC